MAERAHNSVDHVWSVTEASESLDALLDDVESTGEQVIERAGRTFRVMEGGKAVKTTLQTGGNALLRAFLDNPDFKDLEIDRIPWVTRDVNLED